MLTELELGSLLQKDYEIAFSGEKVSRIHLFGIKYAKIINDQFSKSNIIRYSSISQNYVTELSKGINIAEHVSFKQTQVDHTNNVSRIELILLLSKCYKNSIHNEVITDIFLFGIKYANSIKLSSDSVQDIVFVAGLPPSFVTEINKGRKLSNYLVVKSNAIHQLSDKMSRKSREPIVISRYSQLQQTGLMAEEFFINNYAKIPLFREATLNDARFMGDGYDFQMNVFERNYLAEIKGIRTNSSQFRLTENEFKKAREYKEDYVLTLVVNLDSSPSFHTITNPIKKIQFTEKEIHHRTTTEFHASI